MGGICSFYDWSAGLGGLPFDCYCDFFASRADFFGEAEKIKTSTSYGGDGWCWGWVHELSLSWIESEYRNDGHVTERLEQSADLVCDAMKACGQVDANKDKGLFSLNDI